MRDLKLLKAFVEATLSLGVKGLTAEFRGRKRVLDLTLMTEFVSQQQKGRNRYKDVGCLDATRVKLSLGANYVATPSNPKKFICTQAPTTKTCADFWYMMVQERSAVILMLCNFYERGANKCAVYFPAESGGSVSFGDGDVKVTCTGRMEMRFKTSTKVKILVSALEVTVKGKDTHTCKHYHWMDWPDRGVPEADLAPIELLTKHLNTKDKPIVVHCSAGIGRTGSMVLLQHVMDLLKTRKAVEPLVGYMDELRKQRHNSVQTEQQYLYVHMVLLLYGGGSFEGEAKTRFEAFKKDYEKATAAFA